MIMKTCAYYIAIICLFLFICWYCNSGKDGFETMVLVQLLFYAIKNDLKNDNK